ncbi:MAG: LytTR family DNA-binding domain-containing protein [Bacteroidota bacterium]
MDSKGYYLLGSRILTHILFWLAYFICFGLVWSKNGNYYDSFLLEFVLLPIRITAVYLTIYVLLPQSLLKKKYLRFLVQYGILMLVLGLLQRTISHYFYEGNMVGTFSELLSIWPVIRSIVLINSTVLFVSAFKILNLYLEEKEKNMLLTASPLIEIKADKRIFRLQPDQILFIEGMGNYVVYHTTDGQKLTRYASLKQALGELPSHFLRIHKSYIVNKEHIQSYNAEDVQIGKVFLPIGKSMEGVL